jgi:hypothetical protein
MPLVHRDATINTLMPPSLAAICIDAEGWLTVFLLTLRHLEYLSTVVRSEKENERE